MSGLETAPYAFVSVVSGSIGSALVLQQIIMKIIGNSSKVEKVLMRPCCPNVC